MVFSQSFIFRCLETVPAVEFSENSTVDALQYLGDDREVHQLLDDDANYYIQKEGCQVTSISVFISKANKKIYFR